MDRHPCPCRTCCISLFNGRCQSPLGTAMMIWCAPLPMFCLNRTYCTSRLRYTFFSQVKGPLPIVTAPGRMADSTHAHKRFPCNINILYLNLPDIAPKPYLAGNFHLKKQYATYYAILMEFERDDAKNRSNIAKHGVSFEDAKRIFDGFTFDVTDDRHN